MYDNKIALVISEQLQTWQKLNVAAFLASAVAIRFPDTHGRSFVDAGGQQYLPFIKHPILIYQASNGDDVKRAYDRAKERGLHIGIYTRPLFLTKNEEMNVAEVARHDADDHDLVGIVIYGENKKVDKAIKGLKFHP